MSGEDTEHKKGMALKQTKGVAGFEVSELPPKTRSFWQLVGPGAILVGLSIGSGEVCLGILPLNKTKGNAQQRSP